MFTINKAKYLSLLVVLGAWGCTNQNISRSGGGYDDLYGGSPGSGVVSRDQGTDQEVNLTDNPDYSYTGDYAEGGTSDYFDESYISSRNAKRALSPDVGYNAGFTDGYNLATANTLNNGGLGNYWPGRSNIGMQFGFGRGFGMRPYFGMGMGSMMFSPWNSFGSPWGYGSMLGYGGMMGYGMGYGMGYDPFGYGGFGSPWGGYGMGYYDSFYGGYSPWAYSRPVIVVNSPERAVSRTYGPRRSYAGGPTVRGDRSGGTSTRSGAVTNDRNGRRAVSATDTYVSPRSSRSYGRTGGNTGGRTSAETYSRGASEGNNVYYSRPRSTNSSTYSADNSATRSYSSPRSSRGGSTYSSPSYSAPARTQSDYSAPTRSYSQPSRSEYSAPARTYSAPASSAPSRSYSAPSGGGGGGGATRSSSRGPR